MEIPLNETLTAGKYANGMQVAHSREEFILDFLCVYPPKGEHISRLIVSPRHMKRILRALAENIAIYENANGPIEEATEPKLLSA